MTAARQASSIRRFQGRNELFFHDSGSGRPILFLSAWTLQSNAWRGHIATLIDRGFRYIALDGRGHGRSEAPSDGYDLDTLTEDVVAVLCGPAATRPLMSLVYL
jgi:pimeloyl-ACP methyl ester carboxylesterase